MCPQPTEEFQRHHQPDVLALIPQIGTVLLQHLRLIFPTHGQLEQ